MGPQYNDSAGIVSCFDHFWRHNSNSHNLVARYLPASIVVKFVPALRSTLCSVSGLRATNILVLLALPFLYSSLLDIIRTPATSKKGSTTPQKNHLLESISISLFPLVYFFGGLFYTDLGGLILVLASYRAALSERWILSAVVRLSL